MKALKTALIALAISIFVQGNLKAQEWKPQHLSLPTRWAKKVSPKNAHTAYPRPQLVRSKWQNLNGLWEYSITEKASVNFTHVEGKILVPYPLESSLSGVKKQLLPNQLLWYKRTFDIKLKPGKKTILHFGAVDWQATVFINGKEMGSHTGGYTAFSFDITNMLKSGTNEIIVKVYDPTNQGIGPHGKQVLNPANIYYTSSSGIWQTVWMETVSTNYIKGLEITPDVDKGLVNLTLSVAGEISPNVREDYCVEAIAYDAGKKVSSFSLSLGRMSKVERGLKIPNAKLWSPGSPFLYDLVVRLKKDNILIDEVKSYFGMRKISIGKDEKGFDRIMLNNKYTFNLGTLDQGFWPDGLYTAPTDEALEFDIKAIKAMGFNTIRKHIKVEPARWYYHADRLGMMVWQDMVNPNQGLPEGSKPQFEIESEEIVRQLHSYPCITTWVLFNEKWGQYDQERLTKWLKKKDSTRLVNGHSGEYLYVNNELRSPSPNAYVNADMTDVHSYPNPRMPEKQSGKVWVCGEFGGIGVPVPGHQWDDIAGWGYVRVSPKDLDEKYKGMIKQLVDLEKNGLSASIYTQPFDVEGEENGLMTYDREILKIPLNKLRMAHRQLIDVNTFGFKDNLQFTIGNSFEKSETDELYSKFLSEFQSGKKDSTFLRRLLSIAIRKKDQLNVTKIGAAFIGSLKNKFSKDNLDFINHITRTIDDAGFELFLNYPTKINHVLGANQAEIKVRGIIGKEEFDSNMKDLSKEPDWEFIKDRVVSKYGKIGEEKYNGARMFWALQKKDWTSFGKFFKCYFTTAYSRSEYHINNFSWEVFQNVNDKEVLAIAIIAVKYSIDNFAPNSPIEMDTYANLLYKYGRRDEAIQWQERAVKLNPNYVEIADNLKKMRANLPTWDINGEISEKETN